MNKEEKTIKENLIYDGRIIKLYNDEIICPNGNNAKREYVKHPGGSCVLATKNGYIYFEKQYRYPYHKEIFELPAGKIENNEDPKETAKRELKEEIGLLSNDIEFIDYMYPSCGYSNEIIYLYFCNNFIESNTNWDEDELIETNLVKIEDAYKMLDNNEIHDAKTIILMEKLRKRLLKNEQ